jgi:hypothetical protein
MQTFYKMELNHMLGEAIKFFLGEETSALHNGRGGLYELIEDEFKQLDRMLDEDKNKIREQDNLGDKLRDTLKKGDENFYLKNIAMSLQRDDKEKERIEQEMKKKNEER